jgi:hypothetical protein
MFFGFCDTSDIAGITITHNKYQFLRVKKHDIYQYLKKPRFFQFFKNHDKYLDLYNNGI